MQALFEFIRYLHTLSEVLIDDKAPLAIRNLYISTFPYFIVLIRAVSPF
jgi:hypothetical protein